MQWESKNIISRTSVPPDPDFKSGAILLIDKPIGWTSFDVVNKLRFSIRHALGIKNIKVGHAGTLDPLASGLLVICTGKYTKLIDVFQSWQKVYTGEICLGATTPTYDAEADIDAHFPYDHINQALVSEAASHFTGEIWQTPPAFSAVKIGGTAAYTLARKGKEVVIQPRQIHIYQFDADLTSPKTISFSVSCSKGTYIRSLANDIGAFMGSGGYLQSLRRECIGDWSAHNALSVEEAHALIQKLVEQEKGANIKN